MAVEAGPAPLPYPAEVINAALRGVVLPERWARLDAVARGRLTSVAVILESVLDPHNISAVLRTADGLGVGAVHLVDLGVRPLLARTVTRGCHRWMNTVCHTSSTACAEHFTSRGFELYVADARATLPLEAVAARPRVALVFGNEHLGTTDELRAAAKGTFSIPMRGMVESFNVSVAAAIALYATTRGREGELGEDEVLALRARFLMDSVREPELVIERYLRDQRAKG